MTYAPVIPHDLATALAAVLPQARLKLAAPPGVPGLGLWLVDPASVAGPLGADAAERVAAAPPYWAIAWPAGQVMAARILAAPGRVRGRTVLDVGCGSGIVALAAARAGAARVVACDLDPTARAAVRANAAAAGLTVETVASLDDAGGALDLAVAADLLYDAANLPVVAELRRRAARVWVGDCRLKQAPAPDAELLAVERAATWPDLDRGEQFRTVRVYEVGGR